MRKITSTDELKQLASNGGIEVAIILNGGIRSPKFVDYNTDTKRWRIENYCDGSTVRSLSATNIIEAIKKGALILTEAK